GAAALPAELHVRGDGRGVPRKAGDAAGPGGTCDAGASRLHREHHGRQSMIESNQRIEAALAQLGAEYEPPLGWEARVLAATRARRPWWWYAMPGFAVTALAVCAVALWPTAALPALALSVEVQHPAPVRGREGQVGDTVRITA